MGSVHELIISSAALQKEIVAASQVSLSRALGGRGGSSEPGKPARGILFQFTRLTETDLTEDDKWKSRTE